MTRVVTLSELLSMLTKALNPISEEQKIEAERRLDDTIDVLVKRYREGIEHANECHADRSPIERRRGVLGRLARIMNQAREAHDDDDMAFAELYGAMAAAVHRIATGERLHPEPTEPTPAETP